MSKNILVFIINILLLFVIFCYFNNHIDKLKNINLLFSRKNFNMNIDIPDAGKDGYEKLKT